MAPDEVWDHLPRVDAGRASSRWSCGCSSSTPRAWRRRSGCAAAPTPCCRPASSPSPACCRANEAIGHIKEAIRKTYGSKGEAVVQANFRAVDDTLERLFEVAVPESATSRCDRRRWCRSSAPAFVREVTAAMLEGRGDDIPVSHAAGGRHLAVRHRHLGEAQHRRCGAGVGRGDLHPVRPVQLRLPARRDPGEVLRCRAIWTAHRRSFRSAPINVRGFPDVRFTLRLLDRGLHRLRAMRRGLPRGAAQVARDARQGAAAGRRRGRTMRSSPRCR